MFDLQISGNLVADPKQREWTDKDGNKKTITECTIACRSDRRHEKASFVKVVAWGGLGTGVIMPYAKKGAYAMASGGGQFYTFEGKNGPVPVLEMNCDRFELAPKIKSEGGSHAIEEPYEETEEVDVETVEEADPF